jgi:hypothetical protein
MNTLFCNALSERPELHEAQTHVGGYVQLVNSLIYPNTQLLVDEEGLCKNLPMNPLASRVAGFMVVGPALVLTGDARWLPD